MQYAQIRNSINMNYYVIHISGTLRILLEKKLLNKLKLTVKIN